MLESTTEASLVRQAHVSGPTAAVLSSMKSTAGALRLVSRTPAVAFSFAAFQSLWRLELIIDQF